MLKLALCDDEEISLDILSNLVLDYAADRQIAIQISKYRTPLEVIMSTETFDAYILDMVLPQGITGIRLGELIHLNNPYAKFIYVSSTDKYALDAYENHIISYLLKPIDREKFFKVLDKLRDYIKKNYFYLHTTEGEQRFPVEDLLYVDIQRRCFCYHMKDQTCIDGITIRTSFAKELDGLIKNTDQFIFISPAFLINKEEIKNLYKDKLIFKNGKELQFPATYYQKIKDQWQFGCIVKE